MPYYFYLLTNWNNRVIYAGYTNNIIRRIYEHKNHLIPGYTDKYNVSKLVYFEECVDKVQAVSREEQVKGWSRKKKDALVEKMNPEWKDLSDGWGISILDDKERLEQSKNMRQYNKQREEFWKNKKRIEKRET